MRIIGFCFLFIGISGFLFSAFADLKLDFGSLSFFVRLISSICILVGITFLLLTLPESKRKKIEVYVFVSGLCISLVPTVVMLLNIPFPSSPQILTIGVFILTFMSLPLFTNRRIAKWKQYTRKTWHAYVLSLADLFSFSVLILGIFFKIMGWPFAMTMLLIGILSAAITIIGWNRLFSRDIILRKQTEVELQKALQDIKEKNKDITDSITYAKRIQQAKLLTKEEIQTILPNSFVLFKPKDIVSGDFYFFHKKDKTIFLAAVDCTGHGVPGAFMSLIGSEKLDDALSQSTDTSEILKLLNKGVKTSLRQSNDNEESTRDGMDIALCSIDTESGVVHYAGANRPLWIIRNGKAEIEEIKATKKAIGGFTDDNQHFETHTLKLQQGDSFYIFSDGYADTFGGANGKKLTTKKFKELLISMQDKPTVDQELILDNFIENWKAGTEQVDDILVIGTRL